MKHFTASSSPNLTITRLSAEEVAQYMPGSWFRLQVNAEAARFCESKGRNRFRIEGDSNIPVILFRSEDAERNLTRPIRLGAAMLED